MCDASDLILCHRDRVCEDVSSCEDDEFILAPATYSTDTQCRMCRECPDNHLLIAPCNATMDTQVSQQCKQRNEQVIIARLSTAICVSASSSFPTVLPFSLVPTVYCHGFGCSLLPLPFSSLPPLLSSFSSSLLPLPSSFSSSPSSSSSSSCLLFLPPSPPPPFPSGGR